MLAFSINLLHLLLCAVLIYRTWRRNSVVTYLVMFSLFFSLIPLTLDSWMISTGELESHINRLYIYNPDDINNFDSLTDDVVLSFSIYAFVFDVFAYGCLLMLTGRLKYANNNYTTLNYFNYRIYWVLSAVAVIIYVALYGYAGTGSFYAEAVERTLFTRIGVVLMNLFLMMSYVGWFAALKEKRWISAFVSLLTAVTIASLSRARALFAPFFLMIVFYYIEKIRLRAEIRWGKTIIIGGALAFVLFAAISYLREEAFGFYPYWRDCCLQDGYFAFDHHGELYTRGNNLRFLATTWIPGIDKSFFEDITLKIPALKYNGHYMMNLHPTHYAWFFTDLGGVGMVAGCIFGVWFSVFEWLRVGWLPPRLGVFVLPFELGIAAVIIRGSVCYAVTNVLYVMIFMLTIAFVHRFVIKCNRKSALIRGGSDECNSSAEGPSF